MINYNRFKEEKGASNSVSFLVILFFIVVMLISFLDVGLYFNIKNQVQDAAENGARNVALYGGTENSLRTTMSSTNAEDVVYNSIPNSFKDGTVKILDKIGENDISCGVVKGSLNEISSGNTKTAGETVGCEVSYHYKGIAGKIGMFQLAGKDYKVTGTSVSEVSIK